MMKYDMLEISFRWKYGGIKYLKGGNVVEIYLDFFVF